MGQCYKCREFLPPHMMFLAEENVQECAFCKSGKNTITMDDENGESRRISKQEAVGKYKEFMKNVMDNPDLKKTLVRDNSIV